MRQAQEHPLISAATRFARTSGHVAGAYARTTTAKLRAGLAVRALCLCTRDELVALAHRFGWTSDDDAALEEHKLLLDLERIVRVDHLQSAEPDGDDCEICAAFITLDDLREARTAHEQMAEQ